MLAGQLKFNRFSYQHCRYLTYGRKFFCTYNISSTHPPSESKLKENKALGATKVGAVVNLSLALLKGFTGTSVGSTALIADAVNNLGDLFTDAVVYLCISQARRKPSVDRPWGSGKVEPLGALTVGSLVVCTGAAIGYTSAQSLYEASISTIDTSVIIKEPSSLMMDYAAAAVSLAAIASKEALFHYTLFAGQSSNSASVVANAWQHRADALISAAALLGFVGGRLGYELLDPLAAVGLSAVIMRQGVVIVMEAVEDLRDSPAPPIEVDRLTALCLAVPGVLGVRDFRARRSGPYIFVEGVIEVPRDSTASMAYRTAALVKQRLHSRHSTRVVRATLEVCPVGAEGVSFDEDGTVDDWTRDPAEVQSRLRAIVESDVRVHAVENIRIYYEGVGGVRVAIEAVLVDQSGCETADVDGHNASSITETIVRTIENAYPSLFIVSLYLK